MTQIDAESEDGKLTEAVDEEEEYDDEDDSLDADDAVVNGEGVEEEEENIAG